MPQQPQGQQPSGPRRWISLLFYTLAFALIGFYFFGNKEGNGVSKELSYTKLTAYIEAGAIEKIEVTDDLQAKATVKPQSYTLVFGTQGDGEKAKGTLRTQVPSIEEFEKYMSGVNATRKADGQAAIDVKYTKVEVIYEYPAVRKPVAKMQGKQRQHLVFGLYNGYEHTVHIRKSDKSLQELGFVVQMSHSLYHGQDLLRDHISEQAFALRKTFQDEIKYRRFPAIHAGKLNSFYKRQRPGAYALAYEARCFF